jgi:hypothetical protein
MNCIKAWKTPTILMSWMSHFVDKFFIPLYACHCLHVKNSHVCSCTAQSRDRSEINISGTVAHCLLLLLLTLIKTTIFIHTSTTLTSCTSG